MCYLQIPPAPPKPDFESPREKMHKLGEGEATMTKEEYTKMKQELEAWVCFFESKCFVASFRATFTSFVSSSSSLQRIPGCLQENRPSARSLPAKIVLSSRSKQRQKLSDFSGVWPGCKFSMLTCFSGLPVWRRGSGARRTAVTHGKLPAGISSYSYQCSLCQWETVQFADGTKSLYNIYLSLFRKTQTHITTIFFCNYLHSSEFNSNLF